MADTNNTFDIETGTTLNQLIKRLGGLHECQRLGFVFEDEKGVMSPSAAGFAYLMFVVARDITDPAEAFAAGYQAALDEMNPL
ncbi:hypothetical protein ABI_00560 [Asticcacaulis biprosthecium C19]|uniref:Uncharacterized protein n=1 Tax=Asticcacaulis biprosthecium C19 TaxID=715226 RepID=F4QG13_9CAUL|nr:hypothetical protein [Asticcacaulis biprosthecium]EGF93824.1 hypothetical protein ABI_00560 [Asticcacaulis biprosthecium C19]